MDQGNGEEQEAAIESNEHELDVDMADPDAEPQDHDETSVEGAQTELQDVTNAQIDGDHAQEDTEPSHYDESQERDETNMDSMPIEPNEFPDAQIDEDREQEVTEPMQDDLHQQYDDTNVDGMALEQLAVPHAQVDVDYEQEDTEPMSDVPNQSHEDLRPQANEPHGYVEAETEAQANVSNFLPAHLEDDSIQNALVDSESFQEEPARRNEREEDSSSLFVSEHSPPPPAPRVPLHQTLGNRSPSVRPIARPSLNGQSMFARIRSMQKANADRKAATLKQATTPRYTAEPDNEAYLQAVMAPITPSPSTPVPKVNEDVMEDRTARAEYERLKKYYTQLKSKNGTLSFREDVEWMRINGAQQARLKKIARDRALLIDEGHEEAELFPSIRPSTEDDSGDESDAPWDLDQSTSRKRPRVSMPRKEPKPTSMQEAELNSMYVALDADRDRPKKKEKKEGADEAQDAGPSNRRKVSKPRAGKLSGKKPAKATKGRKKPRKNKAQAARALIEMESLFNSNVFEQQAGADDPEQPGFRSRNKQDALKELIASVPIGDKTARKDINILLSATKDFNGRGVVKADGGFWKVKGMRTSLKNYQVLGTAFMRRRENGFDKPRGGLMADQMGLGKTLMMLANIVNGRPPKNHDGPRTTLLVATPALLTQWTQEIERHTDCKLTMMRYGSGTRLDSNRAGAILSGHDIVLTTYNEIMKSYPKNEPPIDCQTTDQKLAWWREVWEEKRGCLHRMQFLRIVLDEAQAIKSHSSRTSLACRALMGEHKWALSGTPILNSLTELYPYFKFLEVPHTGSFKIFKHNYCDGDDAENKDRLLVRLSQFMIRRTHADKMFGAPILKLPQANQSTYWCHFNPVERCIYDIVEQRFINCINTWSKNGELDKSYSNALVMLLRLRQLTAHVLMLHVVMRDLLEREDIEKISNIVKDQAADGSSRCGRTLIVIRKQLDDLAVEQKKKTRAQTAAEKNKGNHLDREDDEEEDEEVGDENAAENGQDDDQDDMNSTSQTNRGSYRSGGDFGKEFNFKPFLASLHTGETWEKIKRKAKCSYCDKQPRVPYITSCGHLICLEPCLEESDLIAAENEKQHSACKACGVTPIYMHPCEAHDEDSPEFVAQGTRSRSKKAKKSASNRLDREDISENWLNSIGDDVLPSAKTIAIKAQILNWRKENPNVKVIIYTQFLAMIRILSRVCRNEGWNSEQYHGKMSFTARDKALHNFADNSSSCNILLASLRCGGLGLNLTMASKVIMVDPWWNTASEQQAFCRVFRIGQQEETYMSRMCVRDTVDERLIEMQDDKKLEIDGVMEDKGKTMKKMTDRQLMRLFGNLSEDSDGNPFILVDNPDRSGGFRADRNDEGYADDF